MADMVLNGITLDRLADRRRMLASVDRFRKSVDSLKGVDELDQKAFDLLTSPATRRAFPACSGARASATTSSCARRRTR